MVEKVVFKRIGFAWIELTRSSFRVRIVSWCGEDLVKGRA